MSATARVRRLRHLGLLAAPSSSVAYFGWVGRGNMGDEALLSVAEQQLPERRLNAWPEGRPTEMLLRAPRRHPFAAVLLGGGTLVGTRRFRESLEAVARRHPRAPLFMTGAGVEDPEFAVAGSGRAIEDELRRWRPLLERFECVTVRGPRSQRTLAEIGIDAEMVGDPALLLEPPGGDREVHERVLGVNLLGVGPLLGGDHEAVRLALLDTCRRALADGWRLRLIPVWSRDVPIHRALLDDLDGEAELFAAHDDLPALLAELARCRVVVGAKLHAVIFAAACGVPGVAVAYAPKCLDFQESVGQDDLAVRTDALDGATLYGLVERADAEYARRRAVLDGARRAHRARLRATYARIDAAVAAA